MYIKRHIEFALEESSKHYASILLTGPRQVGKSTVLRHALSDVKYINLDMPKHLRQFSDDSIGYLEHLGYPLILDEIQRAPELFISLKYWIDDIHKSGMYYLSGSQKYELMHGVSESLAGRVSILNLLGLSCRELDNQSFTSPFFPNKQYLEQRKQSLSKHNKMLNSKNLWQTIYYGSMPKLHEDKTLSREEFYENYLATYIERDVREIMNIGDSIAFMDFMTALAARTGQVLNLATISREIGISQPTLKKWLSALVTSNIVYLLRPYHANVNKRVIKKPKLYFTDTGLACYLCRWTSAQVLKNGAQAGSIFETFVFDEIIKSYYNSGKRPNIYYFRNQKKQEIDLLFVQNNTLFPVEIKKHGFPKNEDTKNFHILNTVFPDMCISPGLVICTSNDIGFLGQGNLSIPVEFV